MSELKERVDYLSLLTAESMLDDLPEREDWEKKCVSTGDIFYVRRKGWKNAGGFSDNLTRKGHPALATNSSPKGKDVMKVVPGSTVRKSRQWLFTPQQKVNYFKKEFDREGSNYVLNLWRTVSRKKTVTPFQIGQIQEEDKRRLCSEMSKFHLDKFKPSESV
jgi:hypothetical protein